MYFNGNTIFGNDGLHAPFSATGSVTVSAGAYPIKIMYFEKDGGQAMELYCNVIPTTSAPSMYQRHWQKNLQAGTAIVC